MNTLLILNGSKCSGKSSIAKNLWKSREKTTLIPLDNINWLYSSYQEDKKYSLELASKVGLKMVETYLDEGIDVIIEKAFNLYEYVAPFVSLKNKFDINVSIINIEAPLDVLIERSGSRHHETMKEAPRKSTVESIKMSYDHYKKNKFQVDETYDSFEMSIDQIVEDIRKKYLK